MFLPHLGWWIVTQLTVTRDQISLFILGCCAPRAKHSAWHRKHPQSVFAKWIHGSWSEPDLTAAAGKPSCPPALQPAFLTSVQDCSSVTREVTKRLLRPAGFMPTWYNLMDNKNWIKLFSHTGENGGHTYWRKVLSLEKTLKHTHNAFNVCRDTGTHSHDRPCWGELSPRISGCLG